MCPVQVDFTQYQTYDEYGQNDEKTTHHKEEKKAYLTYSAWYARVFADYVWNMQWETWEKSALKLDTAMAAKKCSITEKSRAYTQSIIFILF